MNEEMQADERQKCHSLIRDMYSCLAMATSGWEDGEKNMKRFKDRMVDLGIYQRLYTEEEPE